MHDELWYEGGLRFECQQCGECCTGDAGYVWVNAEEIALLAAAVGQPDVDSFEQKYVRNVGIRKSLREFPNGDCVFFDPHERVCNVYQARPRQCRTWPFWMSNLRTPHDWKRTCEACPGCGNGELFKVSQIETKRQVMRV